MDLTVQLRYLYWLMKSVLHIYKNDELLLEDPPSILIQSEKSFCNFPDKIESNRAWNEFVDSNVKNSIGRTGLTGPTDPTQKLNRKQIELIKVESEKWQINKQLDRLVKSQVPRTKHKQAILTQYSTKGKLVRRQSVSIEIYFLTFFHCDMNKYYNYFVRYLHFRPSGNVSWFSTFCQTQVISACAENTVFLHDMCLSSVISFV